MFLLGSESAQFGANPVPATFVNPIARGADPWVVRRNGYYYWCMTEYDLGVAVYRSRSLASFGEKFVVWRAPATGAHCAQVWAPELHFLDGRWYIYVAASNGDNLTHRMIVLESAGEDPTQPFHFKSELYTGDDAQLEQDNRWAIDGTILEHRGQRYLLWSGWADERDEQWLYIAPLSNPWTIAAPRVRMCANDDFIWERVGESKHGRGLNEGPQVLINHGRVFVVYSCSGSWEPSYKLGLLELLPGGNPMQPAAWRKHAKPVFEPTARTCGVGHCSFTRSPDGAENWIVYHAKVSPTHGWDRVVHAQPFTFSEAGLPMFGGVVDAQKALLCPSGEEVQGRDLRYYTRDFIEHVELVTTAGETSGEALNAEA